MAAQSDANRLRGLAIESAGKEGFVPSIQGEDETAGRRTIPAIQFCKTDGQNDLFFLKDANQENKDEVNDQKKENEDKRKQKQFRKRAIEGALAILAPENKDKEVKKHSTRLPSKYTVHILEQEE